MVRAIWFFLLLIIPFRLFAQADSCGVYIKVADFQNNHLSNAINCHVDQRALRIHDRPIITIRYLSKKYKYHYKDIFGFRDCRGVDYRTFANDKYEILNKESIILYRLYEDVGFGEMVVYESTYFFSERIDSMIFPLSRHYLAWVYKKNSKFIELINSSFARDEELISRQEEISKYKLISIYQKCLCLRIQ